MHSVDNLRHGQISFNGAVFDASKSVAKRNQKLQSSNSNNPAQKKKDLFRDIETQSVGSAYNKIQEHKAKSNVVMYKQNKSMNKSNISDKPKDQNGTHGPGSIGAKPGAKKLVQKQKDSSSLLPKRKSSGTPHYAGVPISN